MKNFTINSPEARNYLKYVSSLLLLITGVSALIGGWAMIAYPDGSAMGMSPEYLEHSPFQNYLIPGLVLFFAIGVLSAFVLMALVFNLRHHAWGVIGVGIILCGWIFIQVFILHEVNILHLAFGSIGIILIVLGFYLKRFEFR